MSNAKKAVSECQSATCELHSLLRGLEILMFKMEPGNDPAADAACVLVSVVAEKANALGAALDKIERDMK